MVSLTAAFGALAVAWACWTWISSKKGGIFFFFPLKPPLPNICGSPGGPPVTSPRVRLRDGRHLAYKESGTPRHLARHRVIAIHGFRASKDTALPPLSLELVNELGVYVLSYDRAGYGESDPNPGRTAKDEAMDVQDLADALLGAGERFYLVGASMGGYVAWSCIRHIPYRLAGVALVAPAVSFWWPSFPKDLAASAFRNVNLRDRVTFWIARHFPGLLYAWMSQRIVTPSALATPVDGQPHPAVMSRSDAELFRKLKQLQGADSSSTNGNNWALHQGESESTHRDMVMLIADRLSDPMEMGAQCPLQLDTFTASAGVQVWQGGEDRIVPVELQRYVISKLPWVRYHEFPDLGHMFILEPGWADRIVKALLTDQLSQPNMLRE